MGPVPLRAVAVFSSGGRNRGKCGRGLNRRLVMCIFRERGCRWSRIWGREARSADETSLIQAVCRSSHGLWLGQVELLQHKIPESIKSVVHS